MSMQIVRNWIRRCLSSTCLAGVLLFCTAPNAQMLDTDLTGGGKAHNNMPPFSVINYWIATDASLFSASDGSAPTLLGEVRAFGFTDDATITGWTLADGRLLSIDANAQLFSVLGTTFGGDGSTNFALPDLRSRVPIGTGNGPGPDVSNIVLGQKIGAEQVQLSRATMRAHTHSAPDGTTDSSGGSEAHQNLPPSLGLHCLIVVDDTASFPNRDGGASSDADPMPLLAELRIYAGLNPSFDELDFCHGQLYPIAQNITLFSLLGTLYGGDGRTTLGIPDLRGRSLVSAGTAGGGVPNSNVGEKDGSSSVTLTVGQLPTHQHDITNSDPPVKSNFLCGDQPHLNQSPFQAISILLATGGETRQPSSAITVENKAKPILGQIRYFSGSFDPDGHSKADGKTLDTTEFSDLFSLLGTNFGGDGVDNFAIPETVSRITIGGGTGSGLSQRNIGTVAGDYLHQLSVDELPPHRHGRDLSAMCWAIKTQSSGMAVCL